MHTNDDARQVILRARLEELLTEKERARFGGKEVSLLEFVDGLEQRHSAGEVVTIIRKALGLSLRDFSKMVNLSHTYINKLENRSFKCEPSLPTLHALADGLNISRLKLFWLCSKRKSSAEPEVAEWEEVSRKLELQVEEDFDQYVRKETLVTTYVKKTRGTLPVDGLDMPTS